MTSAPHRSYDLHRFLTFVDACIAIAVTLLVLPLVEAAGDVEKGVPLSDHQSLFWSFLLSFAVIALIWSGHHTCAARVVREPRLLRAGAPARTLLPDVNFYALLTLVLVGPVSATVRRRLQKKD